MNREAISQEDSYDCCAILDLSGMWLKHTGQIQARGVSAKSFQAFKINTVFDGMTRNLEHQPRIDVVKRGCYNAKRRLKSRSP